MKRAAFYVGPTLLALLVLSGCSSPAKSVSFTDPEWRLSSVQLADKTLAFNHDSTQHQWHTVLHVTTSEYRTPNISAIVTFADGGTTTCRTLRDWIADPPPSVNDVDLWCAGFEPGQKITQVTVS